MEKNELEELEVRDEVLNPAREAMRKSIAKKKRFQIYIRSLISIVSIIIILIPVIILSIKSTNSNDTNVWKIYNEEISVSYENLEPESCYSLDYINKNYNENYCYFPEGTIQQTTQYKCDNNIIMIKEEYQYNDLTITLYVLGTQTKLDDFKIPYLEYERIADARFAIYKNESCIIYYFDKDYFYYVQINSIDESITTSIIESIMNS